MFLWVYVRPLHTWDPARKWAGNSGVSGAHCVSSSRLLVTCFAQGTGEVTGTGPRPDLVSKGKVAPHRILPCP